MSEMSNWLKAGLLGAVAVVGLQVLGLVPCVGCFTWMLACVVYGCIGALAAYWMPPVRLPGPAAGQGALASAVAGAVGGVFALIIILGLAAVFAPLVALGDALGRAGFDPSILFEIGANVVGAVTCVSGCALIGVGIAAGLGALGAVIFVALRPE